MANYKNIILGIPGYHGAAGYDCLHADRDGECTPKLRGHSIVRYVFQVYDSHNSPEYVNR